MVEGRHKSTLYFLLGVIMDNESVPVLKILKRNFPELKRAGNEYVIRCRFCGDSKNKSSAHFYVSIGDENAVPLYHCFKCERSGILTPAVLRELIGDENITKEDIIDLTEISKSISTKVNLSRLRSGFNKIKRNTTWVLPTDNVSFLKEKLEYINVRLGLNLSVQEAQNLKIVFSIKNLLSANNISANRSQQIMDELDKHFIGFLSIDNGFLTMRNINDSTGLLKDSRYINYSIYNEKDGDHLRYYCIPTKIDKQSKEPIQVHIAEGCFDILSIYYNLRAKNDYNNIYICSNGKGYYAVLRALIEKFGLYNIILNVYPDNDVSDNALHYYLRRLYKLNFPVYFHRNLFYGEKDFGVRIENIKEVVYKVR